MAFDFEHEQLHAGDDQSGKSTSPKVWHTDSEGKLWCGHWYHRTPKQLYLECQTTMRDLLAQFPEVLDD